MNVVHMRIGQFEYSKDQVRCLIDACHDEILCIVRVSNTSDGLITSALDAGAHGIMFPQVRTMEQVHAAVNSTKYPPLGNRGVHLFRPHTGFQNPEDSNKYFSDANQSLLTIIQIETPEAVKLIDEIASTDGVDVLYFGSGDMGANLCVNNGSDHPEIKKMMLRVGQVAAYHGKISGCHLQNVRDAIQLSKQGFRMFGHTAASRLLMNGVQHYLNEAR